MTTLRSQVSWAVRVNGIADAYLYEFDADRWRLVHGNPAMGSLGIIPIDAAGTWPTMEDAQWIADALAYDHDAPIDAAPVGSGRYGLIPEDDPFEVQPVLPVDPLAPDNANFYWENLRLAHSAAADTRFGATFALRYDDTKDAPNTRFIERFNNPELIRLYAMAARQADLMMEYLCLYRVLEAADGTNGKTFAASNLAKLRTTDFGELRVISYASVDGNSIETNAFETYRTRALQEIEELEAENRDVPAALYQIRNSLAHGKTDIVVTGRGDGFMAAARALPIVKLLARLAVERNRD